MFQRAHSNKKRKVEQIRRVEIYMVKDKYHNNEDRFHIRLTKRKIKTRMKEYDTDIKLKVKLNETESIKIEFKTWKVSE